MKAFPTTLNRLPYLWRYLVLISGLLIIAYTLGPLSRHLGLPFWPLGAVMLGWLLLKIPFFDIPRMRGIGWSPWFLLLFPVPLVGLVLQLLLFCMPSKEAPIQPPVPTRGNGT